MSHGGLEPHVLVRYVLIGNEDLISSMQNGSFVWHVKHIRHQILQTAEESQEEHWWGRSTSSSFSHCQHWWRHSLSPYQSYPPSSLLCSSHLPPTDHKGLKFGLKKAEAQCSTSADGACCCGRLFDMALSRHRTPLSFYLSLSEPSGDAPLPNVSLKGVGL